MFSQFKIIIIPWGVQQKIERPEGQRLIGFLPSSVVDMVRHVFNTLRINQKLIKTQIHILY